MAIFAGSWIKTLSSSLLLVVVLLQVALQGDLLPACAHRTDTDGGSGENVLGKEIKSSKSEVTVSLFNS